MAWSTTVLPEEADGDLKREYAAAQGRAGYSCWHTSKKISHCAFERTLCEFAEKLTLTPAKMSRSKIGKLRVIRLSDRDVLDAVEVISYFNYINRITDGLGVDLETWMRAEA